MAVFPVEKTPLIISGCRVWLDASDLSTITSSGGSVSAWADKSGFRNSPTQATAARQPATGTRTQAGLNVLDFVTNDYLEFPSNDILDEPISVFVVSVADDPNIQSPFIARQFSNASGGFNIRSDGNNTTFSAFATGNSAGLSIVSPPYNSNWNLHSVTFDGSISYSLNGAAASTGSSILYSNEFANPAYVGTDRVLNFLDGAVAEIVIYRRVLSAAEIAIVNRYLANKWGVSI